MAVVGRFKDNDMMIAGDLNERLPVITSGLVAHFPFDGRGGAFDIIGGCQTVQNVETGVNLIEAMNINWRDPLSWSSRAGMSWDEGKQALKIVGYHNSWLNVPIVVDTTKTYQISIEVMEEVQSSTGLYLGGLCNNAAGQKVNLNYDYSYAANAQPATGVWTMYCITRTGTTTIVNRTSQTFANVCGWTGDTTNVAITDKLTKYYYFGGLFNYASGGVMYIRNPKIVITSADTSNCTITSDGISVQEATTNLAYNKPLGFSDGDRWETVSAYPPGLPFVPDKVWRRKNTNTYWGSFTTFIPTTPTPYNRIFTLSCWYYLEEGYDGYVGSTFYGAPVSGGSIYSSISTSLRRTFSTAVKGKWLYGEETLQITTDAYSYNYLSGWTGGTIAVGKHCYIAGFQLEEKTFATAYAKSTRSTPALTIPKSVMDYQSFTVFMKLKLSQPAASGINNMYFDAYPKLYMFRNGTSHYISWADTVQRTLSFGTVPNTEEFDVAVTRNYISATNVVTTVYYNGVNKGSYTSVTEPSMLMNTQVADAIKLQGWGAATYIANDTVKQLSFYNRALTAEEIRRLSKSTFNIGSTGYLIVRDLIEKPIIPTDAYYFQLGHDANSETKVIAPTSAANIVFENRAVWVGTATTNEYAYPTFDTAGAGGGWNHWGQTGAVGTNGQNIDRTYIYGNQMYSHWAENAAGATGNWLVYQSPVFAGGYRSVQAVICMSDGSAVTNAKVFPAWNSGNGGIPSGSWTSIQKLGSSAFYLCKAEGLSQDGTDDLVGFYVTPGNKVYFSRAQLEQKAFCTPFVSGTRAISDLEYNFYSSIGLDWNGNWTICYWKKPVGTQNNLLTGYNIESLGSNSNTVGGGYAWLGKESGYNNISASINGTFAPADYFNKWQFVVIKKNGTAFTVDTYLANGVKAARSATMGTVVSNYYVTPFGYDFKFGWDNTQVCNTYFRDLIVAKRALSDTEINQIRNTQARIMKDGVLQIGNELIERMTL